MPGVVLRLEIPPFLFGKCHWQSEQAGLTKDRSRVEAKPSATTRHPHALADRSQIHRRVDSFTESTIPRTRWHRGALTFRFANTMLEPPVDRT